MLSLLYYWLDSKDRSQQEDLIRAFIENWISCYDTQICDALSGQIHSRKTVGRRKEVQCENTKVTLFRGYKEPWAAGSMNQDLLYKASSSCFKREVVLKRWSLVWGLDDVWPHWRHTLSIWYLDDMDLRNRQGWCQPLFQLLFQYFL